VSNDERRPGWLSRVLGAGGDPRGEGPSITEEVVQPAPMVQPAAIILDLESEIVRLQRLHLALEREHGDRGQDLETLRAALGEASARRSRDEAELVAAREERATLRARAEAEATKLVAERQARRDAAERAEALASELDTARAELVQSKEELGAARADLAKERARVVAVGVGHRRVVSSHEVATKRAEDQRAALEKELATATQALAAERGARADEGAAWQKELASLREAFAAQGREHERLHAELDEQRQGRGEDARTAEFTLAVASRRLEDEARTHGQTLAALSALTAHAARALDLAFGRGAGLAVRGAERATLGGPLTARAEAVATLERALVAIGWVKGLRVVEPAGEPPHLSVLVGEAGSAVAVRALLAELAQTWLAARAGAELAVRITGGS